jgi:hypothetical protein
MVGRRGRRSYLNEKIGVIDLGMNPKNPQVLYAAIYDKQRLPAMNGGLLSGILGRPTAAALGRSWPAGCRKDRPHRPDIYSNPDIVYDRERQPARHGHRRWRGLCTANAA